MSMINKSGLLEFTGQLVSGSDFWIIPCRDFFALGVGVSGTWSGTIIAEGTVDGVTWEAVAVTDLAGNTIASKTTNGAFVVSTVGVDSVRVKFSAYTSGTAVLKGVLNKKNF